MVLALGEKIWRTYNVTQLRSLKQGRGQLFVTNSRLIFHAEATARGRGSLLVLETQISTITGLRTHVSNRIMRWLLGLGVLVALYGLIVLVRGSTSGIVFLVLGAALIALAFSRFGRQGSVTIQVFSQQTSESPVAFGNAWAAASAGFFRSLVRTLSGPFGYLTSLFGAYDAFDFLIGIPGPDALQVASELGAVVHDLQSKGTLAETHWAVS